MLGRVINTSTAGKERNNLVRAVVLAIRELMRQTEQDERTRDLAAFIALALEEIANTIDVSVEAWEKRGYWVKADRFRMDWIWTEQLGNKMRTAVLEEDWQSVAGVAIQAAQKFGDVKIPQRHRMGEPWVGAWNRLLEKQKNK
jgi:hypothetical protein